VNPGSRLFSFTRYGCCAEAVTHAQEKEEPEKQRERLARVEGRSRRRRIPLPGFDSL
jgi:hypothetical protein